MRFTISNNENWQRNRPKQRTNSEFFFKMITEALLKHFSHTNWSSQSFLQMTLFTTEVFFLCLRSKRETNQPFFLKHNYFGQFFQDTCKFYLRAFKLNAKFSYNTLMHPTYLNPSCFKGIWTTMLLIID